MDKKQVVMTLLQALVQGAGCDLSNQEIEKYVEAAIRLAEELHARVGD